MVSIDQRTRTDTEREPLDLEDFFDVQLPEMAAEHSHLAVPGALELGVEPFTFDTPAGAWTMTLADERVLVERGSNGTAVLRLDASELTDLVHDLRTPMTLLTAGSLTMLSGDLGDALDWWVVLRSLLDERAAHTRGAVEFHDRDGEPLDLQRSFDGDDDPAELAHFLAEAGYLHLRGVFTDEEMAEVSDDMDAAAATYAPDDGRSWWARTASGEHLAVRLQYFHEHSACATALLDDDRFLRIGRLTADGHRNRSEGNRVEALFKPIGVVEGISDVPWHKDCSLGRHSYQCSGLNVGISVTGADERSGQLAVVAGSQRALVQPAFFRPEWGLPIVDLPTRTGDVTVHCSCTMHMSHPPIDRERRVMYSGFSMPALAPDAARASLAALGQVREQAHRTVSQAPGYLD